MTPHIGSVVAAASGELAEHESFRPVLQMRKFIPSNVKKKFTKIVTDAS